KLITVLGTGTDLKVSQTDSQKDKQGSSFTLNELAEANSQELIDLNATPPSSAPNPIKTLKVTTNSIACESSVWKLLKDFGEQFNVKSMYLTIEFSNFLTRPRRYGR